MTDVDRILRASQMLHDRGESLEGTLYTGMSKEAYAVSRLLRAVAVRQGHISSAICDAAEEVADSLLGK